MCPSSISNWSTEHINKAALSRYIEVISRLTVACILWAEHSPFYQSALNKNSFRLFQFYFRVKKNFGRSQSALGKSLSSVSVRISYYSKKTSTKKTVKYEIFYLQKNNCIQRLDSTSWSPKKSRFSKLFNMKDCLWYCCRKRTPEGLIGDIVSQRKPVFPMFRGQRLQGWC